MKPAADVCFGFAASYKASKTTHTPQATCKISNPAYIDKLGRPFKTHFKGLRQLHHNHGEKSTQSIRARPQRGAYSFRLKHFRACESTMEHKYCDAADMGRDET